MNGLDISSQLSDLASVWFYFTPDRLSQEQVSQFEFQRNEFLRSWNTHGKPNAGDVFLLERRLIIIVGENGVEGISGCSIDKSVAWIKSLSLEWGMDLMDRNWVMFEKSPGVIEFSRLNLFWALRKAHEVTDDSLIFDNSLQTLGQLRREFKKPFSQSWHARMW